MKQTLELGKMGVHPISENEMINTSGGGFIDWLVEKTAVRIAEYLFDPKGFTSDNARVPGNRTFNYIGGLGM